MRQVELGVIDLDGSVTNWIPELQFAGPWPIESITVSHLLTHTAAIPDFDEEDCGTTEETLSEWAASLSDIHLFAPPGYSGIIPIQATISPGSWPSAPAARLIISSCATGSGNRWA